jgi:archaemetzincin
MIITLQPLGTIETALMQELKGRLESTFGCPIIIKPNCPISVDTYNRERNQYHAVQIMNSLPNADIHNNEIILAVAAVDIYAEELNFIFGQADITNGKAIISLHRLYQDASNDLLLTRATKEAVHEMGHMLGMNHCPDSNCVMCFSNSLQDTDNKAAAFCQSCRPKLLK